MKRVKREASRKPRKCGETPVEKEERGKIFPRLVSRVNKGIVTSKLTRAYTMIKDIPSYFSIRYGNRNREGKEMEAKNML